MDNRDQNTSEITKHPGGRPTKYKPEYCQQIIEFFDVDEPWELVEEQHTNKNGEKWSRWIRQAKKLPTLRDFGRMVGVDYWTVWNWTKEHSNMLHRVQLIALS